MFKGESMIRLVKGRKLKVESRRQFFQTAGLVAAGFPTVPAPKGFGKLAYRYLKIESREQKIESREKI